MSLGAGAPSLASVPACITLDRSELRQHKNSLRCAARLHDMSSNISRIKLQKRQDSRTDLTCSLAHYCNGCMGGSTAG